MKRLFPLILCLATLLAGCTAVQTQERTSPIAADLLPPVGFGSRTPDPAPSRSSASSSKPSVSASKSQASGKEDEPKNDPPKYAATNPPPQSWRSPDVDGGATGKLRLYLRINPGCVEQGKTVTVHFKTKPDVQVAFFTGFKNADGRSTMYDGRTDAFGFWSKTISVRSDQAAGQYDLFAAAADDKGSDGGHSGNWYFVVGEPGKCAK